MFEDDSIEVSGKKSHLIQEKDASKVPRTNSENNDLVCSSLVLKNSQNSGIKTVIFYCFEKVLIRHLNRKLYDVFSEKTPYYIAQFPMVSKVR